MAHCAVFDSSKWLEKRNFIKKYCNVSCYHPHMNEKNVILADGSF